MPKQKKPQSLQRPEQLVIYFKNSAPLNPHVDPRPAGSLCYQLEGLMRPCVKHILKTSFPHLNRGYTRKAGGINTSLPLFGSPGLHLCSLIAAEARRPCLVYPQWTSVSSRTGHVLDYSEAGKVPVLLPAQEVWIFAFWCLFAKYNLLPCQFILISAH